MRQLYYFSVMLICSMLLWNCSKDEENDPGGGGGKASKLDLSVMEIVFDADGGERTVDVKCDGSWAIETKSDWCTLSMTSGEGNQTITITCPEFVDTDDRNVVFTVKAGDLKVILTVIQKPKDALILDKDKFDVPKEGGTVSILAKSTMECTLFIPEEFQSWISRTPSSKALMEKTFSLTIAECLEYDERVGFVEFSGSGLKDTVYIYQAPAGQLILVKDEFLLDASAQEITAELKTNVDYAVTIPESVDWVSRVESKASRTDRLKLSVAENTGDEWREAKLPIKDKNSDLSDTLRIKQAPAGAVYLAQDLYEVESAGETIEVDMLSAVEDFQTAILDGAEQWLKIVQSPKSKSLTEHKVKVEVLPNETADERTGRIAFSDGKVGDTLTIVQAGHIFTLAFETSEVKVPVQGKTIEAVLRSDVDYQLTIVSPADGWISQATTIDTKAITMKEEKLTFEVKANNTPSTRIGKIIVKDCNSDLADTLCITQNSSLTEKIHDGSLTFKKESDLQAFFDDGYTVVEGNVTVSGSELTSLKVLGGQLGEINGNLLIDCPTLATFEGLEGLSAISGDFKVKNGDFVSFAGLEALSVLEGSLILEAEAVDNQSVLPKLVSFEGLSGLTQIGGDLVVDGYCKVTGKTNYALNSLVSFKGLENLKKVGGHFKLNASMSTTDWASGQPLAKFASFEGLNSLESVGGNFELNALLNVAMDGRIFDNITSFDGLQNLKTIGGDFKVTASATTGYEFIQPRIFYKLKSLAGLESLEEIGGGFTILGVAKNEGGEEYGLLPKVLTDFTTLDGLAGLKSVAGQSIRISGCPVLTGYCALKPMLKDYAGTFSVSDCAYNPTKEDILSGACSGN